jgi:signal transduction histidine kinase
MAIPTTPLLADKRQQPSRRSAWERWEKIWIVVFYLSLAVPTALALFSGNLRSSPWLVLGLSVTLGVWYALIMIWRIRKSSAKGQIGWSLIFLIGAFALWFPLARSHWAYYITASSFYGMMWGTLPFWLAVVGNVILTGLIIWSQSLNLNQPIALSLDFFLIATVVVGWAALMAYWMRSIIRESAERKRLIEQLETTQNSLAAAERQAGILQERQRLAQEIHDTLAQGFTSIVMQLEAAEQVLPEGTDPVRGHIQRARDTARASLAEARRLVLALRPVQLEGASLVDALSRLADRWEQESGVKTDFAVTGTPQVLHPEMEVTLLRALQETLANVYKHAQAGQVNVTLSYMDDQVALDIQDNGKGFVPENPAHLDGRAGGGFGLRVLHERVAQLNGEVIIESHPGKGTTVAIQIPMEVAE